MLKVMWPEGCPERAYATASAIQRFAIALSWGLQGSRSRYAWPVASTDVPIVVARRCERQIRGNR